MRSQLITHAALLVVGALLAYLAWNRPSDDGKEKAVVLAELTQEDLEEVRLTWPEGEMTVVPRRDGEQTVWVSTLSYDEKQKPSADDEKKATKGEETDPPATEDANASDAGPDHDAVVEAPKTVRVTSSFPGGRSVARALETLAPLSARRSLGQVPADRLEAMGLASPERTLVVKAKGGKTWTFQIGVATYGDQGRYAKLEGRDEVLLLDAAAVRGLEGTPIRLMEARVVTLESEDISAMSVRAGDRQATFTHVDRDQPKKRHFVNKDTPEQRSEEAAGLLSTLRSLRATKYVDKRALEGASLRASITLQREGEPFVVTLHETSGGSDFLLQAGPWLAEVPASRGKNLLDDVTASLPAE